MSNLAQIPDDYKKFFDQVLHKYLPKKETIKTLFNHTQADTGDVTLEYVKLTQSRTDAKGWYSFNDPDPLADGSAPRAESLGTEDATSSPTTYGQSFKILRKLMKSNKSIIQQYITQHTVELVSRMENYINRTLISNMASNAGQSYSTSGGTWATTGDAVADVNAMKTQFRIQSGGMEADFAVVNPNEMNDLKNDQRFQSTLYTTATPLASGVITPKPLGLNWIEDEAMTTGTIFVGKKGMFAEYITTEPYSTYTDQLAGGVIGYQMSAVHTFVDQYKMPYYLLYGTGI